MPVAATFDFRTEDGFCLADIARLDSMVTVVDARAFLHDYGSADALAQRGLGATEGDTRLLVDLLVEQVEFADTIVLNKADLLAPAELRRLAGLLATFNPGAAIVSATHGRVPLGQLLDTGRFDFERARGAAGWSRALQGEHLPETQEFGITSFVWRSARPLHPARFKRLVEGALPGVIRAKGFFWLATRMAWAGAWQLAGSIGRHEAAGFWFAAVDPSRWPEDEEWRRQLRQRWQEPFGDRRQEIVFIGIGVDEAALRRDLDACLLTPAERSGGPRAWASLPDPFPAWRQG